MYRGESKEASDLIFTVKRTSTIQWRAKLNVYLANNTKEEVCDFKVKASWAERSCTVFTGDSTKIIATVSWIFFAVIMFSMNHKTCLG